MGASRPLLLQRGFDVTAIDVSAEMLRRARRHTPGVTFHQADIHTWPMPQLYDFISAWDSIWHVPLDQQLDVIRKLCGALSAHGVLIFSSGGVYAPNEVSATCFGQRLYHAAPGIPAILRVLDATDCHLRHFEFDAGPNDKHVFLCRAAGRRRLSRRSPRRHARHPEPVARHKHLYSNCSPRWHRSMTARSILFACALCAASLLPAAMVHAGSPRACVETAGWREGVAYVRERLEVHPLVGVGEIHAAKEYFDFVARLLDDPDVRGRIDDVVVEFANARYQPLLDRYVLALQDVPPAELAQAWSEHAESPTGPFDSPLYAGLVEQVRNINQRANGKRLRIVAADLPIDWSQIETVDDYRALGSRSDHLARRTIGEVLDKGRRGLLIFGGAHLSRHSPLPGGPGVMRTAANLIEAAYPGSLSTVNAVASFGRQQALAAPLLANIAAGCVAPLAHHGLGALPGPGVLRIASDEISESAQSLAETGRRRRDLFDAYLWLGPEAELHFVHAHPDIFRDEARWRELDRRARIRFGVALDPESRNSGSLRTLYASAIPTVHISPTLTLATGKATHEVVPKVETPADALAVRVARVFDAYVRAHAFSGTVMISHRGQTIFSRSHGLADEGWEIPNALETRYRIASMTKAFTALAVLMLHHEKRLDINKPLNEIVPGPDPRITFRHLLLHRSGLARDPTDLSDKGVESRFTRSEIVQIATRSNLAFEPGTDFAYSNIGYSLLAVAIEAVTGQTYDAALRELVLEPMSLHQTLNEPASRPVPKLARGYFLLPDGLADASLEDKSHVVGAGSLTSNAGDMIRFLDALETHSAIAKTVRQNYLTEAEKNRTLGLVTWEYKVADSSLLEPRRGRVVMHSGSAPGYESSFGRFLDHDVSIVVLSNRSPFPAASLFNALGNAMLGFETLPDVHSNLPFYRQVTALGPEAVLAQHAASKEGAAYPSEGEINRMGYNLLGAGKVADAITMFRMNALLNPGSANAHDSLGEAYAANAEPGLALASFRRVLELAPGNPAAIRAIRAIEDASIPHAATRQRTMENRQ